MRERLGYPGERVEDDDDRAERRARETRDTPEAFDVAKALEECMKNPGRIDKLSKEECAKIIELANARILEISEPALRAKYRAIAQRVLQQYVKTNNNGGKGRRINIDDSYPIRTANGTVAMRVNTCEVRSFDKASLIGVDQLQIVRHESCGYLCTITDPEKRFWINLKFFIIKQEDGTELRLLYIMDWYVSKAHRGQGIGGQLQQLVQKIGNNNNCTTIFGVLVPEDKEDLDRLKKTKENMGYQISEADGLVIAQKLLQKDA